MKQLFLCIAVLWSALASAQNDAVTNAFLYNKDGELDKAKEEIDRASQHEKTKEKAKTWYFRGLIYENIMKSTDPRFRSLVADAGTQCLESYDRAMKLASNGDEYYENSARQIGGLWGQFLNAGTKQYEAKDFAGSLRNYEMAIRIKPDDSTAYIYSYYSAKELKDHEKVKAAVRRLAGWGKAGPEMYQAMARTAPQKDSALSYVLEGRRRFPGNKYLALEELDLMFQMGRGKEAKTKLEEALKLDSTNAGLYAILGTLYDQEAADTKRTPKDQEVSRGKALAAYRKAVEIDPGNLESNFNLGVYYFNRGATIMKKVNDLDINAYQKSGKKMEADALKEFKESIPYFEASYRISPKDESVIRSLKSAYERVGRSEDAEKLGK